MLYTVHRRSPVFVSLYYFHRHFYIATTARANGSLDFASGEAITSARHSRIGYKKRPKMMPLIAPRMNRATAKLLPEPCLHPSCRTTNHGPTVLEGRVRHGDYCNGSIPPWEAVLVVELLTPSIFMKPLLEECRTVILASGSLAPIQSLCGELGMLPSEEDLSNGQSKLTEAQSTTTPVKAEGSQALEPTPPIDRSRRLQISPKPLEANHVIDLKTQLLAVSVGHFTDGSPLTVNYANWNKPGFISKLGDAIATVVEGIPVGGVLVFLPSYSFLKKCVDAWNDCSSNSYGGVWQRLLASKKHIIVEPSGGGQKEFEIAKQEYADHIHADGQCLLLAVFRGKMSEGISFNDDFARGVICVGIPFPNAFSREIKMKKLYNEEQRRVCRRTDLLPANEWYCQQAYRAIAQALGRCIRHAADYGTIVLMDSRHTTLRSKEQLPKWMRHHVRNLTMKANDPFENSVSGGWDGLRKEMQQFFDAAPSVSRAVILRQKEQLSRAKKTHAPASVQTTPVSITARPKATIVSPVSSTSDPMVIVVDD